jgi:hypothetical protein
VSELLYIDEDEEVDEAPKLRVERPSNDRLGTGEVWEQLRDYVMREVEERFGPQSIESFKEDSIFKAFVKRHGDDRAFQIARVAFDYYDGIWASAPVTPYRFCVGNDPFFAEVIASDHSI